MAKLSRAKARVRSIKGWQTRRTKGWKPKAAMHVAHALEYGHEENAVALVWDSARKTLAQGDSHTAQGFVYHTALNMAPELAQREAGIKLDDWVRNKTQHRVWHRPNGEQVHITGYDRGEFKRNVLPALQHMDAKLKSDITLNTKIEKRHGPALDRLKTTLIAGTPLAMAGATYPTMEEAMKRTEEMHQKLHGKKMTKKQKDKMEKTLQRKYKLEHNRTRIEMTPGLSDFPLTRDYLQPKTLVHEVGHAVDRNERYSGSKQFRDAAKWKRNAGRATGFEMALDKDKKPGWKGGAYQGMSPSEDFAESFSRAILHSMPGKLKKEITYDKPRREYFQKTIVNTTAVKPTTRVKRQWI